MFLLLVALAMACHGPAEPGSIEDCAGMRASSSRDECYAAFVPDLFLSDPRAAEEIVGERIADPLVRDFVYLQVTRDLDPAGGRWCERISAAAVAERCRTLARRPHLQRARMGAAGEGKPKNP